MAPWSNFEPQIFRFNDYAAYYRKIKKEALGAIDHKKINDTYPEPKSHCDMCRWQNDCDIQRRNDDHLCLVANISKNQINEFKRNGIATNSELFYNSKLSSVSGCELQEIKSEGSFSGSGLRYCSVSHFGNTSSSLEEAETVQKIVSEILASNSTWTDRNSEIHEITLKDILIIAPYNAQVFEIQQRIPDANVDTVDKFQGQEAPIAIYSMATSSSYDAPRGMEFLYSSNRFNVAVSRAQCLAILVASPKIFEADCKTPRQMQLANAFCRYLEIAEILEL